MFQPGSIRKIEVKNFVTYSYTELFPGPNLNMLIGPNGTGKSTIVAAIILGLGGNPKVVGRGHRVSEYVKHECQEATIKIYLQGDSENVFIKITRVFTIRDKSAWFLNNERVILKDVLDCIKKYNIQVDNLCQFLPQDRVQEFAKLNQQQLLKETQVALCREDLIQKQQSLIECRDNQKKHQIIIDKDNEKLQEAQDANMRLEGKVENFNKKKEFLNQIQDIDRKIAWIQYDELFEKMSEIKEDLKKATQILEKHKDAFKPAEREIQEAKKTITQLQHINSNVTQSIRAQENAIKSSLEKIDQVKQNINGVINDMNMKIAEIAQQRQEIDSTSTKIEEMKTTQRELVEKYGNDEQMQKKTKNLTAELQKFTRHVTGLQNKKEEIISSKQNSGAQLRAYENEIARLENVKQKRLEHLRRIDNDAYEAVLWLRNNKHLFRGEVFEPIMLEINVLDPNKGIYLENIIPVRDRIAFTCVLKEDMNKLIKCLRNEKKLTINVLSSEETGESVSHFQPTIPIEQLRRFGFYAYMHSLFTAPDPIMRYLCKAYKVHEIPVGNKDTNQYYEQVPKQIRRFFSDKRRYIVSFSRYTGEKSIRQTQISSDGGLSISVDVLRIDNLKGKINQLKGDLTKCNDQIGEIDAQVNLINEKIFKLGDEVKYIHNLKKQTQAIESRIIAMQRKIREMRENITSDDAVRTQAKKKIQKLVKDIKPLQDELKSNYKSLTNLINKSTLNKIKIENVCKHAAYLENKIKETRLQIAEAESTVNSIKEAHTNIKGQARAGLQKAKSLSKNFTPDDEGFNQFRETYERLSSNLQELQIEKKQLNSKIECLNTADDEEMQEYEERAQLITELQNNIEKVNIDLDRITSKMSTLREEWLTPLNHLIMEINLKFGAAFETMGCAGEVSLNQGDDDQEFANYGLCIKVTYRNGEPLQELNNVVQSGGERAVATAAFMLSLQELTPVPFRCVDEINQGMDANNERRIFSLLVEATSQPNTSQYFLITPKLVSNLTYSRTTMVHIIHNGPFIEQDRKWSMSKFCNPQRVMIH